METKRNPESPWRHDAFISYSRKNELFADRLEQALESYTPPKGLNAPQRHLEVFRDKQDFTGNEYHRSLETHLKDSAKLIVICSPEAAQSEYVNDEIRRFAQLRGSGHIIPILLSGVPNNEVKPGQEAERSFPPALCELMAMPLAADYRHFVPGKSRPNESAYRDSWYTVLANLYDLPRAEIEERDRKRRARTRRIAAGLAAVILCVIAAVSIVAWKSRLQAREKARDARQLQYIGNIGLAQQAYDATDLMGMRSLLQAGLPGALSVGDDFRGFEWYYLWRLSQGPTAALVAHDSPVKSIAFSPDGKQLATGADDGNVRLLSADSLKEMGRLVGRGRAVLSVAFSTDGKTLATAAEKTPVTLWEVSSRTVAAEIKELGDSVEQVVFSPGGRSLAAVGFENVSKTARIWDTVSRRVTAVITGGGTASGSGLFVAFSPDGALLALSSGFGIKLCRVSSGESIAEFDGPGKYVSAIAFSPDGRTLAAASDDGKALFFDIRSRRKSGTIDAHEAYVTGVAFSPDGQLLITASADKTVKLWDVRSRSARTTWKGHAGPVNAAAISPDGRTVASASSDAVRLWDVSGRAEYEELKNLDILLTAIAPSPHDDRLALASASTIVIWDPSTRKELARLADHRQAIADVAFSADQRTIAIASSANEVELWDTVSRRTEALPGHTAEVYAVAFSPDGKALASASADRTVRLWNVSARQPLLVPITGHAKAVTAVVFSPDGKTLATGSNDRTVKLWDVESGHELSSSSALSGSLPADLDERQQPIVTAVQFSPDGRVLAASAADGAITLWRTDGRALQKIGTLAGHTGVVNDIVFSPDGRTIASASADATVKLWHATLFRELLTLREAKSNRTDLPEFIRGSENQVAAVAFSHSGRFLVTGMVDGTVRFRQAARNVDNAVRDKKP